MRRQFTLTTYTVTDGIYAGCTAIETADIINYAKSQEVSAKDRFPGAARFTVMFDGQSVKFTKVVSLQKFLGDFMAGLSCEVFRNFDKGITIKFNDVP